MNVPAKEDIDQLHPLADAKNRLFVKHKGLQDRKLESVKDRVYRAGTAIWLTKKLRVNVTAAGQDQSLVGAGIRHIQGRYRHDAKCAQRVFVVICLADVSGNEKFPQKSIPKKG